LKLLPEDKAIWADIRPRIQRSVEEVYKRPLKVQPIKTNTWWQHLTKITRHNAYQILKCSWSCWADWSFPDPKLYRQLSRARHTWYEAIEADDGVKTRFYHSTKCNGWPKRLSDVEWKTLLNKVNAPLTDQELEQIMCQCAPDSRDELKDPTEKKKVLIGAFVSPSVSREPLVVFSPEDKEFWAKVRPRDGHRLFIIFSPPKNYKKMSLAQYQERRERKRREASERYKSNILKRPSCSLFDPS
jgi:hypothetical protein